MKNTRRPLMAALALISVLVLSPGPGVVRAGLEREASGVGPESEKPGSPEAGGEAEQLEQELQGLIEDLKDLGKDVQETFRKEVLPRVREEIRKLREKLEELEKEEEKKGSTPPEPRRI
jgi:peptidoglycan hydrolase CwlO-like protein